MVATNPRVLPHTARRNARIKMARAVLNIHALEEEMNSYNLHSLQKCAALGAKRGERIKYAALIRQHELEKQAFVKALMGLGGKAISRLAKNPKAMGALGVGGALGAPKAYDTASKAMNSIGNMGANAVSSRVNSNQPASQAKLSPEQIQAVNNARWGQPSQSPAAPAAPKSDSMELNAPQLSAPKSDAKAQQHAQMMKQRAQAPSGPAASPPTSAALPSKYPSRDSIGEGSVSALLGATNPYAKQLLQMPQAIQQLISQQGPESTGGGDISQSQQMNRDLVKLLQQSQDPMAQRMVENMRATYGGGQGDMNRVNQQLAEARRYMGR